jgi:acetyl esterase/lipase
MPSPESLQIRSYLLALKAKAAQSAPAPLAEQRSTYEKRIETYVGHPLALPEGTRVESVDVDGIPAEWISPAGADQERVVLFFHGGVCPLFAASHREFIARLSATALVRSLQISYRLAPEHVFPVGELQRRFGFRSFSLTPLLSTTLALVDAHCSGNR